MGVWGKGLSKLLKTLHGSDLLHRLSITCSDPLSFSDTGDLFAGARHRFLE
jgi:hypothetical protein